MPPEAFKELLSKLEIAGPIDSKDFLKILLGNDTSSLKIKDEIKKTVVSKVEEIIGSTVVIKNTVDDSVLQIKSATDNIKKVADIYGTNLGKFQMPKLSAIDEKNTKKDEKDQPSSDKTEEPKLYKTKPDEVNIADETIARLSKTLGLSNKETNSLLKGLKKSVDDENEHLSRLDKFLASKSGGLLDTLFSFGSLLLKGGLALLAGSTFGPVILKTIDNIFGTNLTGLFAPFKESLSKWQGWMDAFGKWSTLLGIKLMKIVTTLPLKLAKGIFGSKAAATGAAATAKTAAKIISKPSAATTTIAAKALGMFTRKKVPSPVVPAKAPRKLPLRGPGGRFVKAPPVKPPGMISKATSAVGGVFKKASKVGGMLTGAVKFGAGLLGAIGKKLLTKIPGIGLLISAGLGIKKLMNGDIVGGLLDITSGLVGLIPFAGIPLSIAIDLLSANVTKKAGGDQKKKGAVLGDMFGKFWKWIKEKMLLIPGMKALFDIGSSIMKGDWKGFLKNASWLIPPFQFLSKILDGAKNMINPKDKPLSFGDFFSNIYKSLIKAVINLLPETILGVSVRSRAAKLLGVDGYSEPVDNTTQNKDQQPVSADQGQTPSETTGQSFSQPKMAKNQYAQDMDVIAASINSYKQGINADNVPQVQPVIQDPNLQLTQDLRLHITTVKELMFNMSNNFKDLNQNLSSQGNHSSVNISSNNSSPMIDSYINGSRDPIFDARSDWWNISNRRGAL